MLKLYHSPRTRSMRIVWLLEELALPYDLEVVPFTPPLPPAKPFAQRTPFGKVPALEDGDVTMFESGAIVETSSSDTARDVWRPHPAQRSALAGGSGRGCRACGGRGPRA
jgi:glutathione S-transferase